MKRESKVTGVNTGILCTWALAVSLLAQGCREGSTGLADVDAAPGGASARGQPPPPPSAPGAPLTGADLKGAKAPPATAVPAQQVAQRFGRYPFDTFGKVLAVKAAIARIDPALFEMPPGADDRAVAGPTGPWEDNQVLRLDGGREILLMSGCYTQHECDTTWHVIAYEEASKSAALVKETEVQHEFLLLGKPDAALRALLLDAAARGMNEQ